MKNIIPIDSRVTLLKQIVSAQTGVSVAEMESGKRTRPLAQCNMIVTKILKEQFGMGWTEQCRYRNYKHAALIHHIKTIDNDLIYDNDLKFDYRQILRVVLDTYKMDVYSELKLREKQLVIELNAVRAKIKQEEIILNQKEGK